MSEEELDLVVVGAGLAGLACAHEAARAGLQVAVCERGDVAGAKNLSGGRLYLDPVRDLCGDLLEGAPVERTVVSESLVLAGKDDGVTFRVDSTRGEGPPPSVTVLRARLDRHLAEQAMAAGAFVMPQQRVDRLLLEGGRVVGVQVGPEALRARVVVAADGALSGLARDAGLVAAATAGATATGVKEVIRLDPARIEERCNLRPGEGAARLFLGAVTGGLPGGGFLYTNTDSYSVGIVVQLEALQEWPGEQHLWELLEVLKSRPEVAPLLAGGETVEYGAHLVPEGGHAAWPGPGAPGLLLVGDAAGLVLNSGFTLRGMDLALASGVLAARSIIAHREEDPGSMECLEHYRSSLEGSFVLRELRAHRGTQALLSRRRLYDYYPDEVARWARALFRVDPSGASTSPGQALRRLRRDVVGWKGLGDIWRLLRS